MAQSNPNIEPREISSSSREDQRREQILDAALNVIVRKGYEKSRIDDIVAESSLSKGAIYWYYKSKKQVYLDLVNHWVFRYSATLNHIIEEGSAADQLRGLFNYFTTQFHEDQEVFRALIEFWSLAGRDAEFRKKLDKVYTELLTLIETILQTGIQSGEFKDLDVHIAALSIMVNIEGIVWFTIFDAHRTNAKEYIRTISDFILAGLTKKSHGGSTHE